MRQLRKDPVVGRWVIIATDRAKRPHDLQTTATRPREEGLCPFCPGHEDKTPPEILAYRSDIGTHRDGPGWAVRVFPNRYPALVVEGELRREGDGIYDSMDGIGAHEVIVETPDHDRSLADLSIEQVASVLGAYRDRLVDLRHDTRLRYAMIFKNHGAAAGATIAHPHSQLIALPTIPQVVADELAGARAHYRLKERCLFCDIVHQELRDRKRLVIESDHFVAIEPYAPRFPFETWILPKRHRSAYEAADGAEYVALAEVLRATLRKLNRALGDPPLNYILHTAPLREPELPDYHWHIEIMPKLTQLAGFEAGSGFYINPTPPEEAAEFLRHIDPS